MDHTVAKHDIKDTTVHNFFQPQQQFWIYLVHKSVSSLTHGKHGSPNIVSVCTAVHRRWKSLVIQKLP